MSDQINPGWVWIGSGPEPPRPWWLAIATMFRIPAAMLGALRTEMREWRRTPDLRKWAVEKAIAGAGSRSLNGWELRREAETIVNYVLQGDR